MSAPATPTGFFGNLETAFENAFQTAIVDAEQLGEFIVGEAERDLSALWDYCAPIVLSSIQAEATKAITGEEKFGNAVQNVYQTAVGAGKPLLIQDAQSMVQDGFNWLQNKLAGTTAAPSS